MNAGKLLLSLVVTLGLAGPVTAQCVGDCDEGCSVAVNELIIGVNIALDQAPVTNCPSFDTNDSGGVEVNELVLGVNNALDECDPATCDGGEITFNTCAFGGGPPPTTRGAPNSLTICLGGACLGPFAIAGELGVGCESGAGAGAGGDGLRACECEFRRFDPIDLPGVGFVCVTEPEGAECPQGAQDCDGGSSRSDDLIADHNVGDCETNEECATLCDEECADLDPPKVRFNSGCEMVCQGGERAGMPCQCDIVGSATCPTTATLACPGGSCEGKDEGAEPPGGEDPVCHCQCIDEAFGDPTPAGSLNCRLPTSIRVEAASPCDNVGVLVRLPPLCSPLTTATHTAVIENANEEEDAIIEPDPLELEGTSGTCAELDSGSTASITLVTNLAFYDSTIGDLLSGLVVKCGTAGDSAGEIGG